MKKTNYKYCFIDVETTGLDRKKHDIFQISGCITDHTLVELESFNFSFRPYSLECVEADALVKTGMTLESLQNLPLSSAQAYSSFVEILGRHCNKFDRTDKMHFVAYNASFDCDYMREFFNKHNDNYFGSWFWNPSICVMQASAWLLQSVRGSMPNFKLGTLCECAGLGWDESLAHDASYDIQQTVALYKYLRGTYGMDL